MNDKKICFILCVNNELFFEECCFYLKRLYIPEGYEVEIKPVVGASSMTSGYNGAMRESDAKYKIYMHQDVFIINRFFLFDMLKIFESDENIGAMGMVGSKKMPSDGVMWHSVRYGNVYGADIPLPDINVNEYRYDLERDGYFKVEAVDGFLIATREDILWREDLFDGWDFYDVSQCFEFLRKGRDIVVPKQVRPWCNHNDGILSLWNYETYREILVKEYQDVLGNE